MRIIRHASYGDGVFHRAIIKYGIGAFDFTVIDHASSREDLNQKERYWIAHFKCISPNGYNLTDGGSCGWKPAPEIIPKITRIGYHHSEETRRKISASNRGHNRKHTVATREKMRLSHLGKKMSPIACAKRAATRRFKFPIGKIIDLYKDGASTVAIAAKFNCDNTTVAKALRLAGVKLRQPGRIRNSSQ